MTTTPPPRRMLAAGVIRAGVVVQWCTAPPVDLMPDASAEQARSWLAAQSQTYAATSTRELRRLWAHAAGRPLSVALALHRDELVAALAVLDWPHRDRTVAEVPALLTSA